MTFFSIASRIPRSLMGIAFVGLLFAASAAAEEPSAPAISTGSAAAEPLPDLSADLQTTLIDRNGHASVSTVHIYRSGKFIRYEYRQSDPLEVWIMDFDQLKEYRIYAADQIYFETPISNRLSYKAQRERLIPADENPNLIENRIVLREDTIEGHPSDIVLLIRTVKDRKEFGADYTLLWEARDLKRQPIRVAYYQPNLTFLILDLRAVKLEPVDPVLLQPPQGFVSMSPY